MSVPVLLIVEDDEMTRELLCEMLGLHARWQVKAVADGSALRNALDTVKPDLILLDVVLSGMSGIDAYQLIRNNVTTANVPVLFVTADPGLLKNKTLPGEYKVLEKPFHLSDLLREVADMLATVWARRKTGVE